MHETHVSQAGRLVDVPGQAGQELSVFYDVVDQRRSRGQARELGEPAGLPLLAAANARL
jgi:hypothetical protein